MPRPSYSAASPPCALAMIASATTPAWPSAKTPALGVPTLHDVADRVDAGERRLERERVDGDPPVDASCPRPRPPRGRGGRARRGRGRRAARVSSANTATLRAGSSERTRRCGCHAMPRSSKAAEQRLRRVGRGRDRHGQRHDQRDLRLLAQAALGEEVVHQQGRLARRRRALEGRRRDGDDHPAALERGQHVPQLEAHRPPCRTRCRPPPGPGSHRGAGRRPAPPPGCRPRTTRRRSPPASRRGRSTVIVACTKRTPGFTTSA